RALCYKPGVHIYDKSARRDRGINLKKFESFVSISYLEHKAAGVFAAAHEWSGDDQLAHLRHPVDVLHVPGLDLVDFRSGLRRPLWSVAADSEIVGVKVGWRRWGLRGHFHDAFRCPPLYDRPD